MGEKEGDVETASSFVDGFGLSGKTYVFQAAISSRFISSQLPIPNSIPTFCVVAQALLASTNLTLPSSIVNQQGDVKSILNWRRHTSNIEGSTVVSLFVSPTGLKQGYIQQVLVSLNVFLLNGHPIGLQAGIFSELHSYLST